MLKDFVPADKRMEQKSETGQRERQNRGREGIGESERDALKRRRERRVGWHFSVKYFIRLGRQQC